MPKPKASIKPKSARSQPVPNVGDTVRFNDFGLKNVFGQTLGRAHMKTLDLRITAVDWTSVRNPIR